MLALVVGVPAQAQDGRDWNAPAADGLESAGLFRAAGRLYGLDPKLLAAIAAVESNDNPAALSPQGAQGLMQLMPATAARFGVDDPFDPIENTLGAARFLNFLKRWQARRQDLATNLPELIAAYNAGPGAVEKYNGIPPYTETRQYVRKVLMAYLMVAPATTPGALIAARRETRPAPSPIRSAAEPVLLRDSSDPLTQLDEIRRQRALALGRQEQALSRWSK